MSTTDSRPGGTARPSDAPEFPGVREVSDVEGFKALADPTRLGILRVLMGRELPVASVKELAEQLGEPQTKLYRHVKVLEAAGLIHVAATRLVSGIVEQRYQASQHDLTFRGPGPGQPAGAVSESAEAAVASVLDNYRQRLFAAARSGQLPASDLSVDGAHRNTVLMLAEERVSRERASSVRQKLQEILDDLRGDGDDPDGVPVNVLIGFFSPVDES